MKRQINLYMEMEVIAAAKKFNLPISKIAQEALIAAIPDEKEKMIFEEHKLLEDLELEKRKIKARIEEKIGIKNQADLLFSTEPTLWDKAIKALKDKKKMPSDKFTRDKNIILLVQELIKKRDGL